jgi:hypothetical protein
MLYSVCLYIQERVTEGGSDAVVPPMAPVICVKAKGATTMSKTCENEC